MDEPRTFDGLEVDEDYSYQRVQWVIERVWFGTLIVLVGLALAGLFGSGWLSNQSSTEGQLVVDWDRFVRSDRPMSLQVTAPGSDGELRVAVSSSYLERVKIEGVGPEPESVEAGPDTTTYVFALEDGAEEATVTFRLIPQRVGTLSGEIAAGGEQVEFRQLVYP